MATINFYHAAGDTPGAVDALLPPLLEKALSANITALVVCPTQVRAQRLDEALWTYNDAAFLPHMVAPLPGEVGDMPTDSNPVVLVAAETGVEEGLLPGRLPMVLAGAESALPTVLTPVTTKLFYMFSAAAADVERARSLWKTLKADGHTLTYWQKTESGWEKKA
jgi:DNA polymerase-3 subunit chi